MPEPIGESTVSATGRRVASLRDRTFSSFKNRSYRIYYCGMLGQMAAMNMQGIVGSLLIYHLTNSAVILGAMSFANAVPMICFSLFGGVIADRVEKKWVMLAGMAAFTLVSLGVALALTTGYLSADHPSSWHVLILSSGLQGAVMGLMMPSRQAIIPQIVSEDQLMNAISLNTMGMNTLQLFAPALAGFMVGDGFNFKLVYFVMTGMYVAAVFFFVFLPKTGTTVSRGISALAGIKEGLSYVKRDRVILYVLLLSFIIVLLSMPFNSMMPVFVDAKHLNVGASGMGILMSVSGFGALLSSLVLTSLPSKKRGIILIISGIALGLTLFFFAFATSWPFSLVPIGPWRMSLVLIGLVGVAQSVRMTLSNTLLQQYVQDEYVGRVMSLFLMQFGFTSLSAYGAGLLTDHVGVQWAIGGFALALAIICLFVLFLSPRMRKLD